MTRFRIWLFLFAAAVVAFPGAPAVAAKKHQGVAVNVMAAALERYITRGLLVGAVKG